LPEATLEKENLPRGELIRMIQTVLA